MKKIYILFLLLFILNNSLFASLAFSLTPEISKKTGAIDNDFGKITTYPLDTNEKLIKKAVEEKYSLSFVEQYVDEDFKYGFAKLFSKDLDLILPLTSYYIIEPVVEKNSTTISIRNLNGPSINFVLDNVTNKIITLSFK